MYPNKRQPNNRYREYTLAFPSDVADKIKQAAHGMKITEQEVIKMYVLQGLFGEKASELVEPVTA